MPRRPIPASCSYLKRGDVQVKPLRTSLPVGLVHLGLLSLATAPRVLKTYVIAAREELTLAETLGSGCLSQAVAQS